MSVEAFVEGVRAELEQQLEIPIVDGFIGEGPLDVEVGCVYPFSDEERESDANYIDIDVRARLYKPPPPRWTPEQPHDTSGLMEARLAIIAALRPRQTMQFGVWFFRVRGFEFNWDELWVEAQLYGRAANPFAP